MRADQKTTSWKSLKVAKFGKQPNSGHWETIISLFSIIQNICSVKQTFLDSRSCLINFLRFSELVFFYISLPILRAIFRRKRKPKFFGFKNYLNFQTLRQFSLEGGGGGWCEGGLKIFRWPFLSFTSFDRGLSNKFPSIFLS